MPVKYMYIIVFVLSGPCMGYGQEKDTISCKGLAQFEVTAFISGHQYENYFDKDLFKKDFNLALSDSTYTIVSYNVSWDHKQSVIYSVVIKGSHVPVTEKNYTLNDLDTGSAVAFDCITIKKGKVVYMAPAFVAYTTTTGRAEQLRKNIVPCVAYIQGYKNNNSAPYTLFRNDLVLQLSDSSYKIIDFVLTWDNEDGELISAVFSGNKILVNRDAKTDLSRKLRPGSTVTIDNIRVEKNGKLYKAKSFVMYLK
jgi:hypothetical protein